MKYIPNDYISYDYISATILKLQIISCWNNAIIKNISGERWNSLNSKTIAAMSESVTRVFNTVNLY